MDWLRSVGYTVEIVERWIPAGPKGFKGPIVRKDFAGMFDLLAWKPDILQGVLGVQCTVTSEASKRLDKIMREKRLASWLAAGNKAVVHGWQKVGSRWQLTPLAVRLQ